MIENEYGILGACMVPHPPIILPEVGRGEEKKIEATTASYLAAAQEIADLAPDLIIISSPHATVYADYFHISPGLHAAGDLSRFGAGEVRFTEEYDHEAVDLFSVLAKDSGLSAGTAGEREPALDHGTMIPLYFIRKKYTNYKLLRIGISGLPLADHYRVGQLLQDVCLRLQRRAYFVGSGDLSHKMKEDGPYGFAPEGPKYDERIMEVMGSGSFGELFDFPESFCKNAAECGHRSFVMMAGALDGMALDIRKLTHEATFGVGYGVCTYRVNGTEEARRFLKRREESVNAGEHTANAGEDCWVRLARRSLSSKILTGKTLNDADGIVRELTKDMESTEQERIRRELLETQAGAFVSLHKHGALRGCIGTFLPTTECVASEILQNAVSAALHDPRFDPVDASEIGELEIHVDVLSTPERIPDRSLLDVKRYGVIVTSGHKRGLLLPDLDGVDTVDEQISIACRKAGIRPGEEISLQRFEVIRHEVKKA